MQDPTNDIKEVVRILLSGNTAERQKVVDKCFSPDATFVHPLLTLRGRRELFDLYQYWYEVNHKITFRVPKVVLSQQKDRLILDLDEFITPLPLPWFAPLIRLIIFLDLQKTPSGYLISRQEDHVLWAESLLGTLPWLNTAWNDYGRRGVGLGICYATRGIGTVVQLFSQYVLPYIPYADNWTPFKAKLRDLNQAMDSKLLLKWEAETAYRQ